MKQLYLDCNMGAAGDMLTAALYEILDDPEKKAFIETMNGLVPEGVEVSVRPETKCGILGTHFDVVVNGEEEHSHDHHDHEHHHDHDHHHQGHVHHSMADVEAIIDGFSGISDTVKNNIKEVYKLVAAAESEVHGTTVSEIHFHEVGMMDAIIDVTAVCLLMDMLGPEKVTASPVRVGFGHMRCAHGILPVPAPATANILRGIPTYAGNIKAELCTPTGAALLRHFASEFRDQPLMTVDRIGYGMGTKDFEICNCIRALMGNCSPAVNG